MNNECRFWIEFGLYMKKQVCRGLHKFHTCKMFLLKCKKTPQNCKIYLMFYSVPEVMHLITLI